MKLLNLIYILTIVFIFNACTNDNSTKLNSQNNTKVSYLYDNAVEGVQYKCKSSNDMNITEINGKFVYKLNCDEIIFSIGKLTIGTIKTLDIKEKVFPSDLAYISRIDTNNPKITNILQVLQSLDEDSNPSNGIKITQSIRDRLSTHILKDLRDTSISQNDLNDTIIFADSSKILIDINKSIAHYETTIRKYVDPTIDTVPPSIARFKNLFDTIDLEETSHTITIIGEENAKIFLKYDDTSWIDSNKTIQDNGEQNLTFTFTNQSKVNFTTYILLQDERENNSSVLSTNIIRKDISPPKINIPISKWNGNTNSYIFNIFEKESFIQNLNATDNSHGILTYSIVSTTNDSRSVDYLLFDVDNTGVVSFKNQPNYDTNIGKVYNVVVRVEDSSANKTNTHIKVSLLNVLDSPPKLTKDENSTYTKNISEYLLANGTEIYNIKDTVDFNLSISPDNDPNLALIKYYLEDNTDKFNINQTTGQVYIKDINNDLFDFEKEPNYLQLKFRVENNNTTIEGNKVYAYLDINITNVVDTLPRILPIASINIPEHNITSSNYIISSIQKDTINSDKNLSMIFSIINGNTNNAFSINSATGDISVLSNNLDFETSSSYNLTIQATNTWQDNSINFTQESISIGIINVIDNAPIIKILELNTTILESTDIQVIVGKIITNSNFQDGNNTNEGYFISPNTVPFVIDNNGTIKTSKQLLDQYTETLSNTSKTAISFDITAKNRWWDGTIHDSDILPISISLENVIDNVPVLKSPSITLNFEENTSTALNTFIYQPQLNAPIYDSTVVDNYYLLNHKDQFDINKSTGKITLKKLFDWESLSPSFSYDLEFLASNIWWDGTEHNSSSKTIHIDINNTIEKPPAIIIPSTINVHENITSQTLINVIKADSSAGVDENNITSITIKSGNDGNFTISTLQKSDYSNLNYIELSTSSNTNLDFESNNSYVLEINATNSFGSTIRNLNINILDDINKNLPLLVIAIEYDDINLTSSLTDIQNLLFTNGISEKYLTNYFLNISNSKFTYKAALETYDNDTNGIIKVHLSSDHHPKNNPVALKNDIKNALSIANNNISFDGFDKNNNNILEKDELQILFLIAGGDITYNDNEVRDDNKSIPIYKEAYFVDTSLILDGIEFENKIYAVRAERNGNHQATVGLISKILSFTTFGFPLGDTENDIDYGYFDLMGNGFKGADINETIGSRPVHPNCYNKYSQGWLSQNILFDKEIYGHNYTLLLNTFNNPNEAFLNCIRINTNDTNIYYLIENRNTNEEETNDIFYDNGLYSKNLAQFEGGLLVWKINTNFNPAKINIVQIDNSSDNIFKPINNNSDFTNTDFSFSTPPNYINSDNKIKTYKIGIILP